MFKQGHYYEFKLAICVVLSVILFSIDRSNEITNKIKGHVSVIFTPVYYVANVPSNLLNNLSESFESSQSLLTENKRLKYEKIQLEGMLQKFTSIKQENQRLRKLLQSSEKVSDKLLVAELLHVSTEPGVQQFVLNQGSNKSVYVGQAVIDSNGVVGQIMNVNHFNSRVLLITDIEHAIPIEVLRNNYRAIAVGMGDNQQLELINVPNTVDIITGDLLVSSGLGKRFPSGYPVGKVVSIDKNPSLPFAKIIIEPIAKINQIREVLLVWPGNKVSYKEINDISEPLSNLKTDVNYNENKANIVTEQKPNVDGINKITNKTKHSGAVNAQHGSVESNINNTENATGA
jgi:rod shape-determining protein MreC